MESEREICALRNELATLRQRIEYLERQLFLHGSEPHAENTVESRPCAFCQQPHSIRTCEYYRYLQLDDRWSVARKLGLCFRCLDNNSHLGRDCPNSRMCRIRGCRLLHHRLLHDPNRRKLRAERCRTTNLIEPFSEVTAHNLRCELEILTSEPSGADDSTAQSEQLYGHDKVEEPSGGSIHSLDSFSDEHIEDRHADTALASDTETYCEDMDETIEPSNNDLLWPSGGEIGGLYRPQCSPSDAIKRDTDSLDLTDATAAACDGETDSKDSVMPADIEAFSESLNANGEDVTPSENKDPDNNDQYSWLRTRMEKAGMFFNSCNESCTHTDSSELQKSSTENNEDNNSEVPLDSRLYADMTTACDGNLNSEAGNMDLLPADGQDPEERPSESLGANLENDPVPQLNKCTWNSDNDGLLPENNDGYSWLTTRMDNAVQQLAQKYRNNESTLLDTLNNQINRLDEEILFYETVVSSDPPAKVADKTLEPMENTTWLMPLHL